MSTVICNIYYFVLHKYILPQSNPIVKHYFPVCVQTGKFSSSCFTVAFVLSRIQACCTNNRKAIPSRVCLTLIALSTSPILLFSSLNCKSVIFLQLRSIVRIYRGAFLYFHTAEVYTIDKIHQCGSLGIRDVSCFLGRNQRSKRKTRLS